MLLMVIVYEIVAYASCGGVSWDASVDAVTADDPVAAQAATAQWGSAVRVSDELGGVTLQLPDGQIWLSRVAP